MTSILPIRIIKARPGHKFRSGNLFLTPKTKRTGPEIRADALEKRIFFSGCRSFQRAGLAFPAVQKISEPVQDLVGPEPLEPVQRLVQRREFLVRDAANLFHGLDVLLIERVDDTADFLALRGEADADRAAIDARALRIEEAEFDQLLQIVGD